ncbi:MAG: hypothetical protein Q8T11_13330 [Elusimicrobiota bacterium]|nr:hypothetical protein [Elusimicrobiota bacterium]
MGRGALILALAAATTAPMAGKPPAALISHDAFPGWPSDFEDHPLKPLPLTERESGYVRDFPGRVGRFSDGKREVVVRWVIEPTRRLHPSADCYQGLGYRIVPADSERDSAGRRWSAFHAIKGEQALHVRELIAGADGRTWSDISSWYWPAALGRAVGPWWAFTVAENQDTRAGKSE